MLARHGLLDRRMVAAHCVLVDDEEIALLAEHDVAVAHCPRSNALLGCGVAPVAALTAAGVRVGLGTDSPASTPSFDMFEEMRAAVLLARASERDPGALLAKDALELATLRAASALDLDDEVGLAGTGQAGRSHGRLAGRNGVPALGGSSRSGGLRRNSRAGGTDPRRRRGAIPERRGDMAKTQTRRKKRTPPPAQRSAASAEDLMFFPRLRKRAKWVFLFLALAFAFGFVGFGVGAGGSGIGDYLAELFNRQPGTGTPSIDDAQARVDKNPADADAQLDLANAYQVEGETDKAIAALTAFLVHRAREHRRAPAAREPLHHPAERGPEGGPERPGARRRVRIRRASLRPERHARPVARRKDHRRPAHASPRAPTRTR